MIYHRHRNLDESADHDLIDLDECVRDVVKTLRPRAGEFDTIVCQGMSGVVVGAPVSLILKKELSIVRKAGEKNHQWGATPEGHKVIHKAGIAPGKRALFLDDFISCGDTFARVREAVKEQGGIIAASYQYQRDAYKEWRDV